MKRFPDAWLALVLAAVAASPQALAGGPAATNDTLSKKIIVGYQGWFACPGDSSGNSAWTHWFKGAIPDAQHLRVEYLPDISEYPTDALCPTNLKTADGKPIQLYSAQNAGVIDVHFRWMAEYGIDGAAVQRFVGVTHSPDLLKRWDGELLKERDAAEKNGRVFYVVYDISNGDESRLVADILRDWVHLNRDLKITMSPAYLHDRGKPVLELWGFGTVGRPGTPAQARDLIGALRKGENNVPAVTLIGGVAAGWRTLDGWSKSELEWAAVYRMFDVLSPWFGKLGNSENGAQGLRARAIGDLAVTEPAGIGYMPVVVPGFSASNSERLDWGHDQRPNLVPRRCGNHYWMQIRTYLALHVTALYAAMFDEVDEGTALFKTVTRPEGLPAGAAMLDLGRDGCDLPSDWYLRITGAAGHLLATGAAAPKLLGEALPR